ncbi:MAG: ABC transporter permease [Xanthomonadales bacterium]|nr:ABC transporter permease [Xanthomonadales bacterium]
MAALSPEALATAQGSTTWWKAAPWAVLALCIILAYTGLSLAVSLGWQQEAWSQIQGKPWQGISGAHWFGTNALGQDIFARAMVGSRTSFVLGVQVMLTTLMLGTGLGVIAGLQAQRGLDRAVLWLAAVVDAIPFYLLAIAVAFAFRGQFYAVPAALSLAFWPGVARLVRADVIRLERTDYIAAARMAGATSWQIARRHIVPNTMPLLLIQSAIVFVGAIKAEVVLSFIGLGTQEHQISWGTMLAEGSQEVVRGYWLNFLAASLLLSLMILSLNVLVDSLQTLLDPRQRQRLEY